MQEVALKSILGWACSLRATEFLLTPGMFFFMLFGNDKAHKYNGEDNILNQYFLSVGHLLCYCNCG